MEITINAIITNNNGYSKMLLICEKQIILKCKIIDIYLLYNNFKTIVYVEII